MFCNFFIAGGQVDKDVEFGFFVKNHRCSWFEIQMLKNIL
jgi:hypothetical protein